MEEYIVSEPFTVEVTSTKYSSDAAMDRYVLTKACEYGEKLDLERIVRCLECRNLKDKSTAEHGECWYCDYFENFGFVYPDGFCSWGEMVDR